MGRILLLGVVFALTGCTPLPQPVHTPARPATEAARADVVPAAGSRPRRARPAATNIAGDFDFYLLNLSWSPEFCAGHAGSPECARHPGFVVHGLWPQNDDGTYPQHCSTAPGPANPSQYTDTIPTASLVLHEWQTHGTCSGLAPDAYFGDIRAVFHGLVVPRLLTDVKVETTLTPQAILTAFQQANPSYPAGAFALTCGNNRLTAVEACVTRDLHAEACPAVRSCGATVVTVTSQ